MSDCEMKTAESRKKVEERTVDLPAGVGDDCCKQGESNPHCGGEV